MGKGGGKGRGAGARRARERYREEQFWSGIEKEMKDKGRFAPILPTTDAHEFEDRIKRNGTQIGLREGLDLAIKVRNHYAYMARLEPSSMKANEFRNKMQEWASLQFRLENQLRLIVRNKREATATGRL